MRTLMIVALALVGFSTAVVAQGVVTGVAEPLQADQITINGARISLYGVDAPDPDMDRYCTGQWGVVWLLRQRCPRLGHSD